MSELIATETETANNTPGVEEGGQGQLENTTFEVHDPLSPETEITLDSTPSLLKLCIACGSVILAPEVKVEGSEINGDGEFGIPPENEIFTSFCNLLKIKLNGRIVWWDFNPGSSASRIFCVDCMRELTLLQDLKRRLEELKRDLENGIENFKQKCCGAEGKFEGSGLYERDKRYGQIRRQITGRKYEPVSNANRRSSLRRRPPPEDPLQSFVDNAKFDQFPSPGPVKDEQMSEDDRVNDNDDCVDAFFNSSFDLPSPLGLGSASAVTENEGVSVGGNNDLNDDEDDTALSSRLAKRRKMSRGSGRKDKSSTTTPNSTSKRKRGRPKRSTETPKKDVPKRQRKWQVISEDDQWNSSDEEREKEEKSRTRKQRKRPDKDFIPETDDDDEDIDPRDVKSERVRFNPQTGHYHFLNVAYEKLECGKFKCLECKDKEIIIFKYTIRKHSIRAHTNAYSCKECGHCEGSNGDLQKHIRDFHNEGGKRYVECSICGKPCSATKGRLERHKATHYSEQEKQEAIARGEKILTWSDVHSKRDYQCDNCGKAFESKWYLKQHILAKHPDPTKEDDEEVKNQRELCPKCGKLFLKYYIKVHQTRCQDGKGPESNRKFICSLCDKRFYRNVELRRHKMSVHEKNYPFKCTHCMKGFSCERLLKTHMNRHLGVRPWPCDHCPSAFFTKGNLVRHVGIYHQDGSNPKRKTYSKKDPPPPPTLKLDESESIKSSNDEVELMRQSHFLMSAITPPSQSHNHNQIPTGGTGQEAGSGSQPQHNAVYSNPNYGNQNQQVT